VLAATPAGHQDPDDDQLIPLTCNEIRRLFTGLCQQPAHPESSCTGHDGDAATNTPPEPAITADEPWHQHDYEVSLED
jgi:hypothetical protein